VVIDSSTVNYSNGTLTAPVIDPTTHVSYDMGAP
jgi:hypothetical protein